jgi:type IV pilus assembly protein PilW
MMQVIPQRRLRGFSLVEILIAMGLGVVLLGAAGSIFLQSSHNFRQDSSMARMLDELGYAAAFIGQDLEMAGFLSAVHDPALLQRHGSLAIVQDCGAGGSAWAYGAFRALSMVNNATPAEAHGAHECIPAADVMGGADVFAVKRVLGRAAPSLTPGAPYLRTQGTLGVLFLHTGTAPTEVPAPYQDWEYQASIYYVQPYSVSADETPRVPTLCRRVLRADGSGAAARFERECLARGVENLQIEIGVDTDEDGTPNYFVSSQAPTAEDLAQAAAVRFHLLVRTERPDRQYDNRKTYLVGPAEAYTPAGEARHYYRRTLSSQVILRNPRSLAGVGIG